MICNVNDMPKSNVKCNGCLHPKGVYSYNMLIQAWRIWKLIIRYHECAVIKCNIPKEYYEFLINKNRKEN